MIATSPERHQPTIGELIRHRTDQLTPAERKVARALFASNLMAGFDPVSALARRAGVSGPTVVRFAMKLGFTGYPEFQRSLRSELEARITSPLHTYPRGESQERDEGVIAHAKDVLLRGVEETLDTLPEAEFEAVVELLADARRPVMTTGGRFTQALAEILYGHLYQLRSGVRLMRFSSAGRMDELLDVGRRDVLVVFDFRRYQKDTIELARAASERGATIVLVTDPWLSPAADVADHVLVANVEAPSPYDSMVAALAVVETLVAAMVSRLGEQSLKRISALEELRVGFTWSDNATTEHREE